MMVLRKSLVLNSQVKSCEVARTQRCEFFSYMDFINDYSHWAEQHKKFIHMVHADQPCMRKMSAPNANLKATCEVLVDIPLSGRSDCVE